MILGRGVCLVVLAALALRGWRRAVRTCAGAAVFGLPPAVDDECTGFPQLLSQTALFKDPTTLQPAAGLSAYAVNQPLWSDGAVKQRWLAVPSLTVRPTLRPNTSLLIQNARGPFREAPCSSSTSPCRRTCAIPMGLCDGWRRAFSPCVAQERSMASRIVGGRMVPTRSC